VTTSHRKRTTLWHLTWSDPAAPDASRERVSCSVYHSASGMELRIESATHVILAEPFDMQPRALARTRALRESLKKRGWKEEEENPKAQIPKPKSQ
jgi:hypothetical protein